MCVRITGTQRLSLVDLVVQSRTECNKSYNHTQICCLPNFSGAKRGHVFLTSLTHSVHATVNIGHSHHQSSSIFSRLQFILQLPNSSKQDNN